MKLAELINRAGLKISAKAGWDNIEITGICDHSQRVSPGDCFVAIKGENVDSHLFLSDAVERGAVALVVDREIPGYKGVATLKVADTREALGRLAHTFYHSPAQDMLVIGITGTNGKTTTSYLIESIFKAAGKKVGVVGTIGYRFPDRNGKEDRQRAQTTTPGALKLARLLSQMREEGVEVVIIEVSSHSIAQQRIAGMKFDVGIFTNITQDHLDYHKSMETYKATKRKFFTQYLAQNRNAIGIFNLDDPRGEAFHKDFPHAKLGYAVVAPHADIRAEDYEVFSCTSNEKGLIQSGLAITLETNQSHKVQSAVRISYRDLSLGADSLQEHPLVLYVSLAGEFNVYNVLAAAATAMALGLDFSTIQEGLWSAKPPPGRFELINAGQPFLVIVDYAHTPESLKQVLIAARKALTRLDSRVKGSSGGKQGRIISVFGCGGDRDKEKRPIMGQIVASYSDRAIITNDNPRSEDPGAIARAIEAGIRSSSIASRGGSKFPYEIILDRSEAIEFALSEAQSGDLVLIAGRGHEEQQVIGDKIYRFDDREITRKLLKRCHSWSYG